MSLNSFVSCLVSPRDNQVKDFVADFPHDLLLQLVQCTAASTKDSDRVSCNAARAIGNLLRYMSASSFLQPDMEKAVEVAVRGLIKNMNSGTMKVTMKLYNPQEQIVSKLTITFITLVFP